MMTYATRLSTMLPTHRKVQYLMIRMTWTEDQEGSSGTWEAGCQGQGRGEEGPSKKTSVWGFPSKKMSVWGCSVGGTGRLSRLRTRVPVSNIHTEAESTTVHA